MKAIVQMPNLQKQESQRSTSNKSITSDHLPSLCSRESCTAVLQNKSDL